MAHRDLYIMTAEEKRLYNDQCATFTNIILISLKNVRSRWPILKNSTIHKIFVLNYTKTV